MEKRVISTQIQEEDIKTETSLRPLSLDEYIGQEKIKNNLRVYMRSCKDARRAVGSRSVLRTAGTGKDDAGIHHCKRNGCTYESYFRTSDRKAGRDGCDPQ